MTTSKNSALGFLTAVGHPEHGLFGGYLLLNQAGRPLEFHCTAPIKPNRAQQILYGPTLEAFLYGEQIGRTLLAQAKHEPMIVCTDQPAMLSVREHSPLPVVLVLPAEAEPSHESDQKLLRFDAAHCNGPNLAVFQLGRNSLALAKRAAADRPLVIERLGELADFFDLSEPFGRIREAIEEAQQAVRKDACA
jgi:hypothetical protein